MLEILLKNIYNFFPLIILSIIIIIKYILKLDAHKTAIIIIYLLSLHFILPFFFLFLFSNSNIIVNFNLNFSVIITILFIILPLIVLLFAIFFFYYKKKDFFNFIIVLPLMYVFILFILYL